MTDKTLAERLRDGADRFLAWAYRKPYNGPPVISIPNHSGNIDRLLTEAADALDAKDAEIAQLRKALIRAEGAMANAAPNGDMQDALLVVRSALWN